LASKPARSLVSVYTPFLRRFTDERALELADTIALYRSVRASWRASRWADANAVERLSNQLASDVIEQAGLPNSRALCEALDRCQRKVIALETTIFSCPDLNWDRANLSLKEQADLRRFLRAQEHFLANEERVSGLLEAQLFSLFCGLTREFPPLPEDGDGAFSIPLLSLISNPGQVVARIMGTLHRDDLRDAGLFTTLQDQFYRNVCHASGVLPEAEHRKPLVTADESDLPPLELVETYLANTPFLDLLLTPVPFAIPRQSRFEHMHIVAGSGHGKTQTLQHLLFSDLTSEETPAIVVIDSQGDLIKKISHLEIFDPYDGRLADQLIIIDPTDVDYPPALNIFDIGAERLREYGTAAREQVLNGVIELYDYLFGSLLGSELTQKQSVIFRYLARLMLTIPGATILDLLNLMTDAEPYKQYIQCLPSGARAFFETEFSDRSFAQTKKQIQRRLWGVLENPTFERMFTAPKNRIDMFDALNNGKIVLVNTAKDFLKAERSSFLGRFFVSLTLQAVLERAVIPEAQRRPAFLYIDEAAEYFDDNIDDLLSQARKYNLGVVFAHQYLDQLAPGLRASIAANASIKIAGGVSTADARSLAPDMRTTPDFLLGQHKGSQNTSFACYVRNLTLTAISLTVPFGTLEQQATMDEALFESLIAENRARLTVVTAPTEPITQPASFTAQAAAWPKSEAVSEPTQDDFPDTEEPVSETRRPEPEAEVIRGLRPPTYKPESTPPPPKPRKQPVAGAALGRGGRQHKYIQHLLQGAAQQRGYHSVIEAATADGAGQVDLLLTKGKRRIACEITVTTGKNWELGNVKKCLAAGYEAVILVSPEERHLKPLAKFVTDQLDERDRRRVRYLTPEGVISYLDELDIGAETTEETVRRYKVKVSRAAVDPDEMNARRDAIAKVLAKSMKKGKAPPSEHQE